MRAWIVFSVLLITEAINPELKYSDEAMNIIAWVVGVGLSFDVIELMGGK